MSVEPLARRNDSEIGHDMMHDTEQSVCSEENSNAQESAMAMERKIGEQGSMNGMG